MSLRHLNVGLSIDPKVGRANDALGAAHPYGDLCEFFSSGGK